MPLFKTNSFGKYSKLSKEEKESKNKSSYYDTKPKPFSRVEGGTGIGIMIMVILGTMIIVLMCL